MAAIVKKSAKTDSYKTAVMASREAYRQSIVQKRYDKFFKKEVVEPIKYHVLAKRYLAKKKKYFNSLSDASKISLKLQGGVLNKNESKEFEKKNFFKHSIKLRKFDEVAKRTDIKMKSIIEYKDLLSSQLI